MALTRRSFLRRAAAAGAVFVAPTALELALARLAEGAREAHGYGPLVRDPARIVDLPAGFQYRVLATARAGNPQDPRYGQTLTNGDTMPPMGDGMGAFELHHGITALVRNHELDLEDTDRVDPGRVKPYDPEGRGGTTTLWVDSDRKLVRSFASLSGTFSNCSGGRTPWGTWLSCEECVHLPGPTDPVNADLTPHAGARHGYVFEVDAAAEGLVDPVPITAMGRFRHEAAAVDPATGFVYLTEDRPDGLLYRFRPDLVNGGLKSPAELKSGDLARGGALEALRIKGRRDAITRNWDGPAAFVRGQGYAIEWVAIPNPDPDMDETLGKDGEPRTAPGSTRGQGRALGCAVFSRGEGMTIDRGMIYFACTDGGARKAGQIWRLDPRREELSLFVEPNDRAILDGPDNLGVLPGGDVVICEDSTFDNPKDNRVVGLTPDGQIHSIARNAVSSKEFAGACFAHGTLFVNIQDPSIALAIWGPWDRRRD